MRIDGYVGGWRSYDRDLKVEGSSFPKYIPANDPYLWTKDLAEKYLLKGLENAERLKNAGPTQ